jgi:hypothetical protein
MNVATAQTAAQFCGPSFFLAGMLITAFPRHDAPSLIILAFFAHRVIALFPYPLRQDYPFSFISGNVVTDW